MTATATGMLTRASRSITTAVDLGAPTADVMLATVTGLRGHDRPAGHDRNDSRHLARVYRSLLGSGTEGEPTVFEDVDDDLDDDVELERPAPPSRPAPLPNPVDRPKKRERHRTAMTLRMPPELRRRLRLAAAEHDTDSSAIIRDALERHLDHLDAEKRQAAAG